MTKQLQCQERQSSLPQEDQSVVVPQQNQPLRRRKGVELLAVDIFCGD